MIPIFLCLMKNKWRLLQIKYIKRCCFINNDLRGGDLDKAKLKDVLDSILKNAVTRAGGVPGVVAMVTDKDGNIYEGAYGYRNIETKEPMTLDTVFAMFSTTKAVTGLILMKLVEDGLVSLSDPVSKYLPEINDIEVLVGYDENGYPQTKKPDNEITIDMLMLHTAGFGYEFFSEDDARYREAKGVPSILTSTAASLQSVLLFEPGTAWNYGVNIDWVGRVIEVVTGLRLEAAMKKYLFEPQNMKNISFTPPVDMKQRRAVIHLRNEEGTISANTELAAPGTPEMDMGGHGLYASIDEYMKFIRVILNEGDNVLSPETVKQMLTNGLGELKSGGWKTSNTTLSNDGEFFPGFDKTWAYTFQVNETALPTGRPAKQVMWAGLANLFYWIDVENGIGGFWATQVLPFHDPAAYLGYVEFESAVYGCLKNQ